MSYGKSPRKKLLRHYIPRLSRHDIQAELPRQGISGVINEKSDWEDQFIVQLKFTVSS